MAATAHVRDARRRYEQTLATRVAAVDPVLAREIAAAFAAIRAPGATSARLIATDRLRGQLFDGVEQELIPKRAREDARAQGDALTILIGDLARTYDPSAHRFELANGLLARAQALAGRIADDLGKSRSRVVSGLSKVRERWFPDGVDRPPVPRSPAGLRARLGGIGAALRARFGG